MMDNTNNFVKMKINNDPKKERERDEVKKVKMFMYLFCEKANYKREQISSNHMIELLREQKCVRETKTKNNHTKVTFDRLKQTDSVFGTRARTHQGDDSVHSSS